MALSKNLAELKQVLEDYIQAYFGLGIVWCVPLVPSAPQEAREKTLKIRAETQEYNESIEEVIQKTVETLYPSLKGKVRFILPDELWSGEVSQEGYIKKLEEREEGYLYYQKLYTGDIDTYLSQLGIVLSDGAEQEEEGLIKGQIAHKGKVKGIVKIVASTEDMAKVGEGDILVSVMTMPKYISAMQRAAAFVTDEGGITCHAAIVAREMGRPCIIGTRIATTVLKDGDMVDVDANNGVVRIVK